MKDKNIKVIASSLVKVIIIEVLKIAALGCMIWSAITCWSHSNSMFYLFITLYCFVFRIVAKRYINSRLNDINRKLDELN